MSSEFAWLTIEQVAPLIAKRKLSPRELLESLFCHIQQHNSKINAFLTMDVEGSRGAAVRAESEILRGRYRGPLHGVPVAIKDNIWTAGLRTTAGSKILADFVPVEDATVIRRLRRAGAVIIGKTNMSEFAYGATNNNQHYGATHNPWNLERNTGGSSGGSAAAVAAGFAFAALGTDTGGSIRIPSALCGVVGLKPTFGRVSCHGTMPLVPAYDHVGPIARSTTDVALMLKAIAGRDPHDSTTASIPVPDFARQLRSRNHHFQLGRPREYYFDHLSSDVANALENVIRTFERAGAQIREVRLPALQQDAERCTAFAYAEATMVHRRMGYFPAREQEYGDDVLHRLKVGAEVRAVDYAAAAEAKRVLQAEFDAALANVDAILAPTVPLGATVIGQKTVIIGSREEAVRSAFIRLNRPANITGLPSITVPCGFTSEGLPIGLQLIGRAFGEAQLLQIARLYVQSSHQKVVRPTAIQTSAQVEEETVTRGAG
jgi:aspartyl-tRNA(Asn)/glutamyl-tRNA(Gln) amidotransferase subunit A